MANAKKENVNETELENETLKKQIAEMQKQFAEMQEKLNNPIQENKSELYSRKINVISLLPNQASLCTERYGGGKTFVFNGYGASRKIRFDELEKLVNVTKEIATDTQLSGIPTSFFERGEFYIADAEAVAELGLEEFYTNILDKKKIDEIVALDSEVSTHLFEGASKDIKDNIVKMIVDKIVDGYNYDLNKLSKISEIYGKDLNDLASKVKKVKE